MNKKRSTVIQWLLGSLVSLFLGVPDAHAYICGTATVRLSPGEVVPWQITGFDDGPPSEYALVQDGDPAVARVAPRERFVAPHGQFAFEGIAPGATSFLLEWYDVLEEIFGFCPVEVIVEAAPENRAPTIEPVPDQQVRAGGVSRIFLNATDADGDHLVFEGLSVPGFCSLADVISGTSVLTCAPDAGDVGAHLVAVGVLDDGVPVMGTVIDFGFDVLEGLPGDGDGEEGEGEDCEPVRIELGAGGTLVVHPSHWEVIGPDGRRISSLPRNPGDEVKATDDTIVVYNDEYYQIYDKDGNKIGNAVNLGPGDRIETLGDRILVVTPNIVLIFDSRGGSVAGGGTVPRNPQPSTVIPAGDKILVVHEESAAVYDKNGRPLIEVPKADPDDTVQIVGGHVVVVSDDFIEVWDLSGSGRTYRIPLNAGDTVQIEEGQIRVTDESGADTFYDVRTGRRVPGRVLEPGARVTPTGNRIVVAYDDRVEFRSKAGRLYRRIDTQERPTIHTFGHRVLVETSNRIKIFNRRGKRLGRAISTGAPTKVLAVERRFVVHVGDEVRFYTRRGVLKGVHLVPADPCLIVHSASSVGS